MTLAEEKNLVDDKTIVKDYFNQTGFDRWRKIYGTDEVNRVQLDIRNGHQQTVDTVLDWLKADDNLSELSICDAGCGVGSLSIPLAQAGAQVFASDISEKMVGEAQTRAQDALENLDKIQFKTQDLEQLDGEYHSVICLDVLIHYPHEKADEMIGHLCSLAKSRVILSFAPKTCALAILKKIGSFFPGPSKTTRAYMHKEKDVIASLEKYGFKVERNAMTKTRFYYSRILEATRA
ncbi:magnesium protoporphyrin IX methyltransferase [Roseofilum capinflatum]|uniref:Magnesium protoporphyrin IX methyltransferase n=1 Tax=Roseofilum capinflatum BLCC-M114 TaxID=3022440 RepID=A0ABT7BEL0_9CYAN|nr:magnesium protoporphyrin IX methyltransferase [Roseofilum capinflatum]MDJ1177019.1 magnesium protoporphyrin IX methyltransferase [Roseofilum capinflatum BLCC-M114]